LVRAPREEVGPSGGLELAQNVVKGLIRRGMLARSVEKRKRKRIRAIWLKIALFPQCS
jgi:hypothetical protein